MKKLLSLSLLLCLATVLAVTPAHADTKVYESKTIRMYGYQSGIFVPGVGLCDIEAYLTAHMTVWETKDGSFRTESNMIGTLKLIRSGEVIGEGMSHSTVVIIVPMWPYTIVNQMDIVMALRGSGQVFNWHIITVYEHGELVAYHIVM